MKRLLALAAAVLFCTKSAFSQPCALACASGLNVSLGPFGATPITPDMITNVNSTACLPNGNAAFSVTVMTATGVILPTSPVVGCANIGQTLTVKLTHLATGNVCWSTILIQDKLPPVLVCADKTVSCATTNTLPTNPQIGQPTVSDNCDQSVNLTFLDQFVDLGCGQSYQGQTNLSAYIKRTWTATDDYGNRSTCLQHVFLQRKGVADLLFPIHRDGVAAPALPCDPPPMTTPAQTGWPTIDGQSITTQPGLCELLVNFSDQIFQQCGTTKKILRTWTAVDDCTSEIKTALQIIKIVDETPPNLTCPADFTVDALAANCSANVLFPPASASDACSGASVSMQTDFGFLPSNGGLLTGVPVGQHVIVYKATDGCGNFSTCSATVEVRDAAPPTVICDAFTVAPLTSSGTTTFSAKVLDQGSYDNCTPLSLLIFEGKITSSAGPFSPNLTFDCSHVGVQNVTMRVRDLVGNENECAVQVQIQDKIAPTIVCPANVTIECKNFQPGGSLPNYGMATAADNCPSVALVELPTVYNLSACGVGTVVRKFKATDAGGRTSTCSQVITVINSTPFSSNSITWPTDFSTAACVASPSSLHPDSLATAFSKPKWISTVGCSNVAASWEDQIFQVAPPACWQIVRKWTVVDWCQFNPNVPNSAGKWTKTQLLKISDAVAPTFLNPQKDTTISLGADCLAAFSLPIPQGKDCSSDLFYSVTSPIGAGPSFLNVPKGVYEVRWKVADGCGNETIHLFKVTVKDLKKPSPICTGSLAVNLMQNGTVAVWAKDFNASSFDNCTPSGLLKFSFSMDTADHSRIFDCTKKGANVVRIWATDAAGNQDFCEAILLIQDNAGICPPTVANLVGGAKNEKGETVENILFELKNHSNTALPIIFQQNTGGGGFAFFGQPIHDEYEIRPSKNDNPTNGVTSFDLVKMSKHILGVELLGSPFRIIAADVNRSNTVSTADIVTVRKVILGILPEFPNQNSWRFVPADFVFPQPMNPFSAPFPESKIISSLAVAGDSSDFVAIKVGDLNASADPTAFSNEAEDRNPADPFHVLFSDQIFEKGQQVAIDLSVDELEKMDALQFELVFDTTFLVFEKAEGRAFSIENLNVEKANAGTIRAAWTQFDAPTQLVDNQLVTLIFEAKKAGRTSQQLFHFDNENLAATGWKNEKAAPLKIAFLPAKKVVAAATEKTEIELFQNAPNPFSDKTEIQFWLPSDDPAARLDVFDAAGRLVFSQTIDGKKGHQKAVIERSDLPVSASIFAYRLTAAGGTQTRKMIATR